MAPTSAFRVALFFITLVALATLAFKLGENLFAGRGVREPAALHRTLMDFSNLPDDRFAQKAKEHLMETLRFDREANSLVLKTGHFLGPHRAISACNTYPKIEYRLTAEGVAVDGEPSIMQISMACEPTSDQEGVEPASIDIRDLVALKPVDQSILMNGKIQIETHNFPDSWPNEWVLTGVVFRGQAESIELNKEDLQKLSLTARTVRW